MGKTYIHIWAGINQRNSDPSNRHWVENLNLKEELEEPNYKEHIQGVPLRRLSPILKKSLACAQTVQRNMGGSLMDGIIVATGLGCLGDTKKFLLDSNEHDSPSPTPFIHSTHNTIAGQLGLQMKCHGYNITHTQVGACFEGALIDATLQETDGWYLVGAVDEQTEWLDLMIEHSHLNGLSLGAGATFMAISKQPSPYELVDVVNWRSEGKKVEELIKEFLDQNNIDPSSILTLTNVDIDLPGTNLFNFQQYSGAYLTNTGFGIELALQNLNDKGKTALVVNGIQSAQIGLTLLCSV